MYACSFPANIFDYFEREVSKTFGVAGTKSYNIKTPFTILKFNFGKISMAPIFKFTRISRVRR